MKIAVLPGDGIGREIVAQAVKVLRRLERDGLRLELSEAPVGGAGVDAAGDPLPDATLKLAREADAILFGAVGDPSVPDKITVHELLLPMRRAFDLYANVRPGAVNPAASA